MAKRGSNKITGESGVNGGLVIQPETNYNNIEQIRVTNKFPARLMYKGQVTGQLYIWEQAGAIVDVDARDLPELLSKKIGETSCCGSSQRGNSLFEI